MDSGTVDRIHLSEGTQVPFLRTDFSRRFITRLTVSKLAMQQYRSASWQYSFFIPFLRKNIAPLSYWFSARYISQSNVGALRHSSVQRCVIKKKKLKQLLES